MRDLYRKLEIERSASKDEIAAALREHPELAAYSAVLLDEERRALYDRVHNTLKMVGTLRFRLDLDKSDARFIRSYPDFAIMPKPALGSRPEESGSNESTGQGSRRRKGRARKRWLYAVLAAIVLAAAAFLALTLY